MKILILGGSGMVGHRLWLNLMREHETWVTVRGDASQFPDLSQFPHHFIRPMVDALNFDQITRALASIQPDLVINCIGLIKQQGHIARDPIFSISLNALLPHRISLICRTARIRMIHISTDCVFTGRKGNYVETDDADATDLYGRTKLLGEVAYPHCVTIRTSLIGREIKTRLGLIEWFLAQQGTIRGFQKAIFSGLTTDELSRVINDVIIPHTELSGVIHVSSDPISKHDLLTLVKEAFKRDVEILPDQQIVCDRSLNSEHFRQLTAYHPHTWEEMVEELARNSEIYKPIGG